MSVHTVSILFEPTYVAEPGYDFTTGLGSVDVFNLISSWPGSNLD
jgi:hypothetical protein